MIRPTLTDLNPIELNYYPLMVSLYKCNGICNAVDNLSTKFCAPSKRKHVHVKVFNTITELNKVKTSENIFHVIVNASSILQHAIQTKNGIMANLNVSVKSIVRAKRL